MINNRERRINRIKMQKFLGRRIRDGIKFDGIYLNPANGAKCVIGSIFPKVALDSIKGSYLNSQYINNEQLVKKFSGVGVTYEETLGYSADELGQIQTLYDAGEYKECLEYLNSLPIEVK